MYGLFYDIIRMGEAVPASVPASIDLADVYSEIFPLLKEEGEYLGLIDPQGTTLQVMYHADEDRYWFEVPRPDLKGSFGAYLSWDSAHDLIKSLAGNFPKEGYPGFQFNSW